MLSLPLSTYRSCDIYGVVNFFCSIRWIRKTDKIQTNMKQKVISYCAFAICSFQFQCIWFMAFYWFYPLLWFSVARFIFLLLLMKTIMHSALAHIVANRNGISTHMHDTDHQIFTGAWVLDYNHGLYVCWDRFFFFYSCLFYRIHFKIHSNWILKSIDMN